MVMRANDHADVCPICGARPMLVCYGRTGDGGKRFLLCAFCCRMGLPANLVPTCGKGGGEIASDVASNFRRWRVEPARRANSICKPSISPKDGTPCRLVDDLAHSADAVAHEHGYSRLQPNRSRYVILKIVAITVRNAEAPSAI